MRCSIAAIGLFCIGVAQGAPAPLVLDTPESAPQSGIHRIQVLDDGSASVRLKGGPGASTQGVDFALTPFKADGLSPVAVGFDAGKGQPLLPYWRNVTVPAAGMELHLTAPALAPDVEYSGHLLATADHQTLIWDVTLVRSGLLPPFVCPSDSLQLSADGSTTVELRKAAPIAAKTMTLRLSPFTSKDQELGDVGMLVEREKNVVSHEWPDFPLAGEGALQIPLRTTGLVEGSVYSGKLLFLDGTHEILQCALTLQMPKLARGELVANISSIARTVTMPFWGGVPPESVAIVLSDKTRAHRIHGVTAILDGTSETPDGSIDPERDLRFIVNGQAVTDPGFTTLTVPVPEKQKASRTIPPGALMTVDIQVAARHAGKYAFSLSFSALNSTSTPPKVDTVINVRHHVAWAVLAMVVALLVSFTLTKGIVNWRERARVRARVAELRRQSFVAHSYLPTAVFMRAVLDQTAQLLKPIVFVAPPTSVYDFLKRAEWSATILRGYASIQRKLNDLAVPEARPHYADAIAEIMRRIGTQPLDQATTDGIVSDLSALAATMSDAQTWYWAALKTKSKILLYEASRLPEALEHKHDRDVIDNLLDTLAHPPADPNSRFDDAYWVVKLLVSRRLFEPDFHDLVSACRTHKGREYVFKVGDRLAWERLENAVRSDRIKISIADGTHPLECLRPTKFFLDFQDCVPAESYLVRNILDYTWHFDPGEAPKEPLLRFPKRNTRTKPPWDETSKGARTTQYMPYPGKLDISVTIQWPGADLAAKSRELQIKGRLEAGRELEAERKLEVGGRVLTFDDNSELDLASSLTGSELLQLAIVFAITLATGLPTLYFAKPDFGSFADYVAILAWAVGVDQGKNLIQLLKAAPLDPPASGSASAVAS
jgi:hypothetical protein